MLGIPGLAIKGVLSACPENLGLFLRNRLKGLGGITPGHRLPLYLVSFCDFRPGDRSDIGSRPIGPREMDAGIESNDRLKETEPARTHLDVLACNCLTTQKRV